MSSFHDASILFDTTFDTQKYFESMSAEFAKNSLIESIEARQTPLLFLLGAPGVGKTYLLHLIEQHFPNKTILFATDPFRTPEALLSFLLHGTAYDAQAALSELKASAITHFKEHEDHLIIIDEAQLLDESVLEFIRLLTDTGHCNFLLSMHQDEGMKLVKQRHFASRNHRVVTLGVLQNNEIQQYIEAQLLTHALGGFSELFQKKQVKTLKEFSQGNFRVVKQLLKHTFSIMDYAKTHGHNRYTTPTSCVITMAAIDLGMIDA